MTTPQPPRVAKDWWVLISGTLIFVVFSAVIVATHVIDLRNERARLLQHELPHLVLVAEEQLVSYFDIHTQGLKLLAQAYQWEPLLQQYAANPEQARRQANAFAEVLGVKSVDFVDIERLIVHAYWSDEPVRLDPNRDRDAWFFETWHTPNPPETQITLYYDENMGGHAAYTDQLLRNDEGEPIGVIGVLSDVGDMAGHIQRTLIDGEYFYLVDRTGSVLVEVTRDSHREFGPVYDLEGLTESRTDQEDTPRLPENYLTDTTNLGTNQFTEDKKYVYRTVSIPELEAVGMVFLNVRSRLAAIQRGIMTQMALLLGFYMVMVGSYIALVSLHSRRIRAQAALIQQHRVQLDDLLSVLTHNLSNDLHALRQHLPDVPEKGERTTADHLPEDTDVSRTAQARSAHAVLLDMEQVLQNAVYATQLGSTDVRAAVSTVAPEGVLDRLYRMCRPTALAKDQSLRIVNRSSATVAVDQDLLFHVLFNLAGNAIKFSPLGTSILLGAFDHDRVVEFVVADQGPGFVDEDRMFLFQKNRRLSARPTNGERSTGMGLYVTRRLADVIGASLSLLDTVPQTWQDYVGDFSRIGAVWSVQIPTDGNAAA